MKYTTAQVTYHWLSFALILIMLTTGLAYSYEIAEDGAMLVHQVTGQTLIVVLILRIASRVTHPPQHTIVQMPAWQRRSAQAVHLCLYLCLIAFVVTGYVSASAETSSALLAPLSLGFARSDTGEMLLEAHYTMKWVLMGLVGLHVAAALKHHLWDKDATLTQMTFSKTKG